MISQLGKKVRRLRVTAGMSQSELAKHLGMSSRGYISAIESGDKLPTAERVLQIALLFHVTTDFLLRDDWDREEGNIR